MAESKMDPPRVRAGAAKFDSASDEVEAIAQRLEQALGAAGNCWGADESGQAFAKDYVPGSEGITEALSTVKEALHNLRGQVDGAADDFERIDSERADDISRVET